jgi:hypothetical protein
VCDTVSSLSWLYNTTGERAFIVVSEQEQGSEKKAGVSLSPFPLASAKIIKKESLGKTGDWIALRTSWY